MFRRHFFFGRLALGALLLFLLVGAGSRLFRSGYEQGFVQGASLAATDGEAVAGPVAPEFGRGWGYGRLGRAEGALFGFGLMCFGFVAFAALLSMMAFGRRRHWDRRHPGGHWAHHHHGHWKESRRDGGDPIGPEKQPQEYV